MIVRFPWRRGSSKSLRVVIGVIGLQGTILVVDDDPSILRLLNAHLVRQGWTTHTRESAVELEETILTLRPDVVLCDLCLPDRDAVEFLLARNARDSHDAVRATPIVIMSAYALVETAVDSDMDIAGVIRKPLDLDALDNLIEAAAERGQRAPSS